MQANPQLRALNRFGLGARPGESRSVDPRSWLRSQINPAAALLTGSDLPSAQSLIETIMKNRARDDKTAARKDLRQFGRQTLGLEAGAALRQAMTTDAPFAERLARFWSNHLAVSTVGEPMVALSAGAYEREAIRPHVFGRFADMVQASARHPAMLIYLDQVRSIGPNARAGRNNRRGLNENYARELLELHTLGVDGGYDQRDVEQLALILTGWTIGGYVRQRNTGPVKPFAFADAMHEPGSKTLLGRRYPQGGENEGTAAIANLCRHPSTARFLATKLVRHFVSDRPHPLDIDIIAGVYLDTDGDLAEVSLALLDLDGAFYGPERKIRSPQEFLIAMGRGLGLSKVDRKAVSALTALRHIPWSPPSPAGYSDEVADWGDPDVLLRRADLARMVTKRARARLTDAGAFAQDVMEVRDPALLNALLAEQSSAADQATLVFASPDFQWR
ncbi:MAG: DUF1800 domain-containing protein [Alphaproteobacteria bacterium]|nr:DUF1800 domain-containing protein [Alphaproteobacteria bacterium]